jgi:mediator of RNA polymerase II transcription subunit 10
MFNGLFIVFLWTGALFKMDSSQNIVLGSGGNGMLATPLNDTAAAVDDPKQNLNQVIDSIQKTLGQLHQLYLTVSSFNTASQLPLLQRLYFSINPLFWFVTRCIVL